MAERLTACQLISLVLDDGSFESWDAPPPVRAIPRGYAAELASARARTGLDEAVITGAGSLRGTRVAVMACEFGFLAGSIGVDAAERLTAAVERATQERLPLLAAPVSGGTRMQEGTMAFVQMIKISAAIARHKAERLPYLVYLRDPTTGGVLASWGSLGHVTVAEPHALLGFLGPRVFEVLYGEPFPADVQTSENLYAHGLIDAVVPPEEIAEIVARALAVLNARLGGSGPAPPASPPDLSASPRAIAHLGADKSSRHTGPPPQQAPIPDVDAWESVTRSRRDDRPGVRRLLRSAASDVLPLNGTGEGEAEPGLLIALARFGQAPCVLLGQDRRGQTTYRPLGPGALREARRGMRLAAELQLPLVSIIDTPGAALSVQAEEGGLAGEIARSLSDLVSLAAPTLTVLLGQGTGGVALALLPSDRVLAAQHAWLSPLPPEGASAILFRSVDHAADMARAQHVRSLDLFAGGIVDRVIPEIPDAADEPVAFCRRLGVALEEELMHLLSASVPTLMSSRSDRYRRVGW